MFIEADNVDEFRFRESEIVQQIRTILTYHNNCEL